MTEFALSNAVFSVLALTSLDQDHANSIHSLISKCKSLNAFQTPLWLNACASCPVLHLLIFHDNHLILYLPLQRLFSCLPLVFTYVNPLWSDYSEPIVDSTFLSVHGLSPGSLIFGALKKLPFIIIFLRNVFETSPLLRTTNKPPHYFYTSSYQCCVDSWRSTKYYKKNLYYQRRFYRDHPLARLVSTELNNLTNEHLADIVYFKNDQYKRCGINKSIEPAFWGSILSNPCANSRLLAVAIYDDKTFVSGAICLLVNDCLYYIIPSYNILYSVFSPGIVAFMHLYEIAVHGNCSSIDLTIGCEPYKHSLSSSNTRIASLLFTRFSNTLVNIIFSRILALFCAGRNGSHLLRSFIG